jgi:hypothetical protein
VSSRRELLAGLGAIALSRATQGALPAERSAADVDVAAYGASPAASGARNLAAFQAAIDACAAAGGGRVVMSPGTYALAGNVRVKARVFLDLQGATLNVTCAGSAEGISLRDHARLANGTVHVIAAGKPGASGNWQCPVVVGDFHANIGYTGVRVSDLVISSTTVNGNGILVTSGSSDVIVENVTFPSSATLGRCVLAHWGGDGGVPPRLTTHPHNIVVRNITAGSMTLRQPDQAVVLLSAVYNTVVENVSAARVANALVWVTAGDYGFLLAAPAVREMAHQGIDVRGCVSERSDMFGFYANSEADNYPGAPLVSLPVVFRNCKSVGMGPGATGAGFKAIRVVDATFENCEATKHARGFSIEERSRNCWIRGGRATANREAGVFIGHARATEDCGVDGIEAYQNGQSGTAAAGVFVGTSFRTRVLNCVLGHRSAAEETTQIHGIRTDTCTHATIRSNHVRAVAPRGTAYSLSSTTEYSRIWEFDGNGAASGVTSIVGGVNPIPIRRTVNQSGRVNTDLWTNGTSEPTSGQWEVGDKCWFGGARAGDVPGKQCVSAGPPAVWKAMGALAP